MNAAWIILIIFIALLISTPVLVILGSSFTNTSDIWQHLAETVLIDYLLNSFWLMVGVGVGVLILGISTAWLVSTCRFPGYRHYTWLLLLPFSAPAYLLAYTYTDMLDFYGPVQSLLRSLFGWETVQDYWFPDIRSLWGAIAMFILVLYPYVYLLARVAFLEQSVTILEASRALGCTPWDSFKTVALPLARPAIVAGLALAEMETLNDFGTVEYFGISTFTTGIYRTWFGFGERYAAVQLAAILMLFIIVLILLERRSRHQSRYYDTKGVQQCQARYHLQGIQAVIANLVCFLPVLFGLLIPSVYLISLVLKDITQLADDKFWALAQHSFLLSGISAAIAVIISLVMAYGQRLQPDWSMRFSVRTAVMGYAVPGSVIAVGVLIPLGAFDNALDSWMRATFNLSTGLLFSGTITALIYAYLVRFLAVSFGAVESSLNKIKPSFDEASRSLGYSPWQTLRKIHIPLISGGMLTAAMLVFVDVMKELSATMVIRPFNFDTLAIRVYQYASDERLLEAAAPALAIVIVGLIPVMVLSWQIARSTR